MLFGFPSVQLIWGHQMVCTASVLQNQNVLFNSTVGKLKYIDKSDNRNLINGFWLLTLWTVSFYIYSACFICLLVFRAPFKYSHFIFSKYTAHNLPCQPSITLLITVCLLIVVICRGTAEYLRHVLVHCWMDFNVCFVKEEQLNNLVFAK